LDDCVILPAISATVEITIPVNNLANLATVARGMFFRIALTSVLTALTSELTALTSDSIAIMSDLIAVTSDLIAIRPPSIDQRLTEK
jgi:hypothetical protein